MKGSGKLVGSCSLYIPSTSYKVELSKAVSLDVQKKPLHTVRGERFLKQRNPYLGVVTNGAVRFAPDGAPEPGF